MRFLCSIFLVLFLSACGAKPCTPGDCLRSYDQCHTDGKIVQSRCRNCDDFGSMTERQAALIDAKYECADTDADRQLMRLNGTVCSWTVEHQKRQCELDRIKWPKDSDPDDCSKYKRPYKYVWPTWEEWITPPSNVVQEPEPDESPSMPKKGLKQR